MLDPQLVEILACPENKSPVHLADESQIAQLNQAIAAGKVNNRSGAGVDEKIEGGLIREDGKWLYPVRDDIPIMLVEEGIALPLPDAP